MKIALAQLNFHVGNFPHNRAKILAAISNAKNAGADLVVFSELSICGYPPKDLLFYRSFIDGCSASIGMIAKECVGIAAIVGCPVPNPTKSGKPFFNTALLLSEGKVVAEVHKSLIPNYDIFDEYRYFEPGENKSVITFKGFKIGITICEDIWNELPGRSGRYLYRESPPDKLAEQDPHCIINISASPFSYNHGAERKKICEAVTHTCKAPLFYLNTLGANTELIFDGGSIVTDKNGKVLNQMHCFSEGLSLYDLKSDKSVEVLADIEKNPDAFPDESSECLIYKALVLGIRDYFHKNNLKNAILGLSGGIDSALVLALAAEALSAENVYALLLPSRYTSQQSVNDAHLMAKNIGCRCDTISIEPEFKAVSESLAEHFAGRDVDVAEENIQSRLRGLLIMAASNKDGSLMLNTSNKSELATGYGTLYGDMGGALSVIGDLYKTKVYSLARYLNTIKPGIIPESIIIRPPTAELKADQLDTDSLPPYGILDSILYQYIEEQKSVSEIKVTGADTSLIADVIRKVDRNEFKRKQFAPILRVSPKAFGEGRRMPIVAKYIQA